MLNSDGNDIRFCIMCIYYAHWDPFKDGIYPCVSGPWISAFKYYTIVGLYQKLARALSSKGKGMINI